MITKILILKIFITCVFPYCVTFSIDLNNFNEEPEGNWVVRANGNWNNWGTGVTLSDDDGDHVYYAEYCGLNNGEYQFVFAITGEFDNWSNWGLVSNAPMGGECDFNPNDNYANYGFIIQNNNIELQTHAWNCCGLNDCDYWQGCNSGAINTVESYLYGRFEVRMKSADGDGLVSSFFTYNTNWQSNIGNLNWNEIDIEMTGNRDNSVQFTTHHPGDPNSWSFGEIIEVEFNPHTTFNDYAFEWTPSSIKWFVNNHEVYSQNESIVDDLNFAQEIMMNLWPAIWENWVGEWDNQDTPKHAYYDYVKYYEYTPNEGDYGSNNNFTFSWEDDFNFFNDFIWEDNSSGTFNGNFCSFTPSNTNYYNGHLILTMTDENEIADCNQITGDLNLDNYLNIVDIVLLVDYIVNSTDLEICEILSVDIDFNYIINVIDIVGLVEKIIRR